MSRISIVKPEKARGVEDLLIRMAQSGKLQGQVTEPQLVQYLEQINTQIEPSKTKIVVRDI